MFIDRKAELGLLEERLKRGRAEFVVLYGRRRIGKTALLLEFIGRHGGLYLLARETSEAENLRRFSERLAAHFNDEFLRKNPLRSWDAFFEYLHGKAMGERLIVAIDEFPYLVKGNGALPSILQEYWDLKLSRGKIFLMISGSSVGMMERLLGYRSPLYGRRTAQLRLRPLNFFEARAFLPGYTLEDFVKVYGILGGTPAYLLEFSDGRGLEENLLDYFRPDSFLYGDALFILREELDEPRNYFAIMEAIARGKTTLGEITSETGLERGTVGKYLGVLIELDLVRREVPVTASWKSRKGRYHITDPYFTFWFRYVYPNADLVESGQGDALVELVMNDLPAYLGGVFEEIARQFLGKLNKAKELPFRFTKIGRWWHKSEEIDLLALNEREKKALFVEAKWKSLREKEARGILRDLERKSELVGLESWGRYYGLVAREVEGKEGLKEEGYLAWDLEDFEEGLNGA
ncbi:putative ATPase (AAA+ superfamily) 8 [Thermococcus cleftensis]|uniref:ATPase (AAA+ superfamily) 8 n=1 Tax=Thermococcus cleftensis (strain DSM 27260 / KACC 17922 / CL1) TaxID=163003 RepID=I3ZVH4_THECF|nr:ATP-binding protein [Thermococcus cleftensis]AFL95708.1 putative ATPase (AAA+ superfamily) 8 [Thermococcus cleftensis]